MTEGQADRKPLGPASVDTNSLVPNPHNPRMLFDEEPLSTLRESIQKVGILVPLTVYREKGSQKYTILDGQRRWICAQELDLPEVPINEVAEPSVAANILTMFQIHKLREDWELMPTALKVGVLMEEFQEKRDQKLAELTALDPAVISRCKKLLWYPKKYQEMMLLSNPKDRMKADFFIELYTILNDRIVKKANWYKRDYLIERFLHKYRNKLSGIKAVTDFRKIKQYISAARHAGKEAEILKKIKELLDDDNLHVDHLELYSAVIHKRARTFTKSIRQLHDNLKSMDLKDFYGEEALWKELQNLYHLIRRQFLAADRRLP